MAYFKPSIKLILAEQMVAGCGFVLLEQHASCVQYILTFGPFFLHG